MLKIQSEKAITNLVAFKSICRASSEHSSIIFYTFKSLIRPHLDYIAKILN